MNRSRTLSPGEQVIFKQLVDLIFGNIVYRRPSHHHEHDAEVIFGLILLQMQRDMVANDGIADNTAKRTAQLVYDSYHSLGGNGHGTQVNQDIQDAPIAPRKPQA